MFLSNEGKKFFFIGLGLEGPSSLSQDTITILQSMDKIYFEIYTNFMSATMADYEKLLDKTFTPIYRNSLEAESRHFLLEQKDTNSALIISGDPFIATTHYMLLLEAVQLGLQVEIINNVSVYSMAPSVTGLSAYKFGKTVTIAFPDRIKSDASYHLIQANLSIDAHTLVLLDVDLEKQTFLPINEALRLLLEMEERNKASIISPDLKILSLLKLGSKDTKIHYKTVRELISVPWETLGAPQALIIPTKLSSPEQEILESIWSKERNFFQHTKKTRIVVTGTFDILHPGHLEFFENAKKLAIPAELWVVVARNSSVNDFKKRNPILDENVRVKMLNALTLVDHALLGNESKDKIKIMEEIKPDIICLGYDQWINEEKLKGELVKRGLATKVIRLPKYGSNGYSSSTEIRNKIKSSEN